MVVACRLGVIYSLFACVIAGADVRFCGHQAFPCFIGNITLLAPAAGRARTSSAFPRRTACISGVRSPIPRRFISSAGGTETSAPATAKVGRNAATRTDKRAQIHRIWKIVSYYKNAGGAASIKCGKAQTSRRREGLGYRHIARAGGLNSPKNEASRGKDEATRFFKTSFSHPPLLWTPIH